MSGQYSSKLGAGGAEAANTTSRASRLERIRLRSDWWLATSVPSGSVIRTGGILLPKRGGSMKAARQSKSFAHLRGFFTLATLPLVGSTNAYTRSPRMPRSVMSAAFSSSPIMDLTGYRQRETTEPKTSPVGLAIWHLLPWLRQGR